MENIRKNYAVTAFCLLLFSGAVLLSFTSRQGIINKPQASQKCLIVSDIHFNPLYGASSTDTALKRKLETWSFAEWKQYFESSPAQMTLDSTLLYQDATYAVLRSALYNMKKKLPHPAFIIIAGDFIWHNATTGDSILKKKTIQFIARLFKEHFPGALIIPAMGNNDTYGNDYALQDPKFLKDFAAAWEPNLPTPSADSLKAHGYYTCETGNLKVIVLNSAPLDSIYHLPQPAGIMLNWLHNELANANGKNIWILMHIPPGLNGYNSLPMWDAGNAQTFVNDIVKYAPEVKFMVASHTHFNDFKVVYDNSRIPAPVSFMRIVPSICSNHGNYPSFEIAEINSTTYQVTGETNWFLNLKHPSNTKGTAEITWKDSVILPSSLKLGAINAGNFSKLINHIKADKTGHMLKSYVNFYNVGTPFDSAATINRSNYSNYMRADSLKGK